jgi:hypothetical protein
MQLRDYFKFNLVYFALAITIFIVEILIALYVHDQIVRPYIGDLLVVILIYCFVKAFFNFPVITTSIFVLIFACLVETLQYFKFIEFVGLEKSNIARVLMGTDFEWIDIVAYSVGIALVIAIEKGITFRQLRRQRLT